MPAYNSIKPYLLFINFVRLRNLISLLFLVTILSSGIYVIWKLPNSNTFNKISLFFVILLSCLFVLSFKNYRETTLIKLLLSYLISNILSFETVFPAIRCSGYVQDLILSLIANLIWISIFYDLLKGRKGFGIPRLNDLLLFVCFPIIYFLVILSSESDFLFMCLDTFYFLTLCFMFYLGLTLKESNFYNKNLLYFTLAIVLLLHLLYSSSIFFEKNFVLEQVSFLLSHLSFLGFYWFLISKDKKVE